MKQLLKETDPRFLHLQKKVGIFIIASLLLGVALFIGIERDLLTSQYHLYFTVDRGRGLTEGMPVKLSGFKIGKVKSITLDEQAQVKAEITVNKKYVKWIRKNAVAWLMKEGLFGSYIIEISPGATRHPSIENGDTLEFDKQKELEDVVEELKPTLEQIKGLISYVNDPQGDIKVTLHNLRQLSGHISTTRQNLDNLIKNADGEVKVLASDLHKTLNEVSQAVNTINKDLPKTMNNISKSAENIEKISRELKSQLPATLNKVDAAASDTQEILEGAKRSWPVKNMVTPPQEKVIKGDSYE